MQTLEQKQKEMRDRGTVYDKRHGNKQRVTVFNTEAEYWEQVLQQAGLGMNRGLSKKLFYWGRAVAVEEMAVRLAIQNSDSRKVVPQGHGPIM